MNVWGYLSDPCTTFENDSAIHFHTQHFQLMQIVLKKFVLFNKYNAFKAYVFKDGEPNRIRTCDTLIKSHTFPKQNTLITNKIF